MTISAWAGPEYTQTKTIVSILGESFVTHNSLWSVALGANFGWRNTRNSVRAGYSRQVSDGGGIIATSQVNGLNGEYRRMITPKWDATAGVAYTHAISTTTARRSYSNIFTNVGVNYKISKSFDATARYGFTHWKQSNAFLIGTGNYNTNIFSASISYSWNHPLGR
jgi:hypothetical protein